MEKKVLEKVESVLDKYRDLICNVNSRFSFGRKVMGNWSSTKILILGTSMTNVVFYKYLVEQKLIVIDFVKCNSCKGMKFLELLIII